jgi:hypothetical protein
MSNACIVCDREATGAVTCVTCAGPLCSRCSDRHCDGGIFQDHDYRPGREAALAALARLGVSPSQSCVTHQLPVRFICTEAGCIELAALCDRCVDSHQKHALRSLASVAPLLRSSLVRAVFEALPPAVPRAAAPLPSSWSFEAVIAGSSSSTPPASDSAIEEILKRDGGPISRAHILGAMLANAAARDEVATRCSAAADAIVSAFDSLMAAVMSRRAELLAELAERGRLALMSLEAEADAMVVALDKLGVIAAAVGAACGAGGAALAPAELALAYTPLINAAWAAQCDASALPLPPAEVRVEVDSARMGEAAKAILGAGDVSLTVTRAKIPAKDTAGEGGHDTSHYSLAVGTVVCRGKDWKWGMQDGGPGCRGKVCAPRADALPPPPGWVPVLWDVSAAAAAGAVNFYRYNSAAEDLEVVAASSSSPMPPPPPLPLKVAPPQAAAAAAAADEPFLPLQPGERVRRGPAWKWGDQDCGSIGMVVAPRPGALDLSGWVTVSWGGEKGANFTYRYSPSVRDVERCAVGK